MFSQKRVFEIFLNWARRSFQREVVDGFPRAKSFDAFAPRLATDALVSFSRGDLDRLACSLPLALWVSHPAAGELGAVISEADKSLIEEFRKKLQDRREREWQAFSELITRNREPESQMEAKTIKAMGLASVRELAIKWQYQVERVDEDVWRIPILKEWGKICADIDFESPFELKYSISIYDLDGVPLRQADHYLGVLGIAPSAWSISKTNECQAKVRSACDFIRWHLSEYEALMERI